MRIGIVSDTHDRTDTVQAALTLLREHGAELVLHCGDIESVETVRLFASIPTHFVLGNWDGDWISGVRSGLVAPGPNGRRRDPSRLRQAIEQVGSTLHEPWGDLLVGDHQIAWVHGDDRSLLRELEESNCYDYLFYGHTHAAEQHRRGRTLVVNPGALFRAEPKRVAVLDLESGRVESVIVPC